MKKQLLKIRDRKRTELKIIASVGQIIEQYGVGQIGVNLISRTSGVNKVLIYRYFETVDTLVSLYVQSVWEKQDKLIKPLNRVAGSKGVTELMINLLRELRQNISLRELLHWEIQHGKTFLLDELMKLIKSELDSPIGKNDVFDQQALAVVLGTGICMLSFLSNLQYSVMDIDLQTELGWKRIEKVIENMIESVVTE